MNLNVRVKGQHVDFEEKTYYASFSGELEASASPMWALVSHLKDSNTREYTVNVLKHCLTAIREWMEDVQFDSQDKVSEDALPSTFYTVLFIVDSRSQSYQTFFSLVEIFSFKLGRFIAYPYGTNAQGWQRKFKDKVWYD